MKEKMAYYNKKLKNNDGSTILAVMLILVILTVIGISAMNNSTTEYQIAVNDRQYKTAFYTADSGTELGRELIEQNIACPQGFTQLTFGGLTVVRPRFAMDGINPGIEDANGNNALDSGEDQDGDGILDKTPSESTSVVDGLTQRDIHFPPSDTGPHTNITAEEKTVKFIAGNSMLMAEGYSGMGKGSGSGGAQKIYDIHSQFEHRSRRSCANIIIEYRHIIGTQGDCEY
ncbi:PilX [Desulfamplus magnetovallimortis]|uniref:PilX n=1 Tax=Desulfamplus magnetovallimortis TaxID=1246637 RepID=A0A1W1HI83_9BACT|nr:pilus assembly PilX N-terminal domain-containing protein [Desulfamplus magnetovallimortis]SLM32184.1 PilX [Desulfamplus magnetovallimortis]